MHVFFTLLKNWQNLKQNELGLSIQLEIYMSAMIIENALKMYYVINTNDMSE